MAERILVTGADGFVGRQLVGSFSASFPSSEIVAWTGGAGVIEGAHRSQRVDITDADAIRAAIDAAPPDIVVHLAALSSVGEASGQGQAVWRVNAFGAFALAESLRSHAPTCAVVFASSGEVYGGAFRAGAPDEKTCPDPNNVYARSKLAAEQIFSDVLAPKARLVALRLFNHTGPGQDERFVAPAFAAQIARIEAGKAPPVLRVGDLTAVRDFHDVRDVLAAYVATLACLDQLPLRSTFNVCSGVGRSIRSILDALISQSSAAIEIEQDPARLRPSPISEAVGDGRAFANEFGWRPAIPFSQTLTETLAYWRGREASDGAKA